MHVKELPALDRLRAGKTTSGSATKLSPCLGERIWKGYMDYDPEELRNFLEQYERYAREVLKPTKDEIRSLFAQWTDIRYWGQKAALSRLPAPSPVQFAKTRVKRPEGLVDKILRRPSLFPDGFTFASIQKMHDAVAGRVVVYFLAQLPVIDREIRESELLEISQDIPPVAYLSEDVVQRLSLSHLRRAQKDSGYASVHYIVRLRQSSVPREQRPWFELQVRTLAENLWGEVEHVLGYKPDKRTSFAVRKHFQIISAQLHAIDEHFNFLFEELSRFQEEVTFRDGDPLNAENLPAVLNEIGTGCAQREIDGLLKLLNSRGIENVGLLRAVATGKRMETIRNTYWNQEGRAPNNFEIIATLAAIKGTTHEGRSLRGSKDSDRISQSLGAAQERPGTRASRRQQALMSIGRERR